MSFRFRCATCGETHDGMPTFAAEAPLGYYAIREDERETRCVLDRDHCVIDGEHFFVRGCIEIPVHGQAEPFIWGVWVSLSESNYRECLEYFNSARRSHRGPYFGWLNAALRPYPDTVNLRTRVHLRNDGLRPLVELEPTEHPLAVEQRSGISIERVGELYAALVHGDDS